MRTACRLLPFQRTFALASLALVLGGCGSSAEPSRQVLNAVGKTLSLPGVAYTATFARPRLFGSSVRVLGGNAVYDLADGIGYEALSLRVQNGLARTLYLDFLPAGFYLAPAPAPAGVFPAGKSWIAVTLARTPSTRANDRLASQATGLAPELALDEIAWGARSASSLGSTVVGHIPMSEYRVSVNLTKALSAARAARRPALAAAIASELRATPSGRISLKVWVNGPGYIAKVEAPVPGSGLGTVSFSFTGFTAGFKHTRPLPSQTVSVASLPHPSRSLWATATGL